MDFDDTPTEAAFRHEARAWIEANAPHELRPWLERSAYTTLELPGDIDPIAVQKDWQRRKYEAGWACIHWPKAYGGRDASPMQRLIWEQEEGVFRKLNTLFIINLGIAGPTIMACGAVAQRARLLPPCASGEQVWCQLFSEPSGGSDLAGLRTRAESVDDGWIVNGQKIWTSGAQDSDWGLLIARTDPRRPKHAGLTMFVLKMDSPGVEVRPIKSIHGQSEFNEVFFTDVRIPDHQRLGGVNDGWRVTLTTLMNERSFAGATVPTGFEELFDFCAGFETENGLAIDDARVKSRLAHWAVRSSGLRHAALRAISLESKGEVPGPEHSIGKLVAGSMMQEIAKFALDLQAEAGIMVDAGQSPYAARFQAMLMQSPAQRILGGTDEILRNIIAERILGLPPDVRIDKDVPFDQIPTAGR
jgi:alkylation response protein AidB-like acyl-CoA dehydrogenase